MKKKVDVQVSGGGSVFIFTALTKKAQAWVNAHTQIEDWQLVGAGLSFAVDHYYARDLAHGMVEAGLVVR